METRIPVDSYDQKLEEGKEKFLIRRWYEQRQREEQGQKLSSSGEVEEVCKN